MVVTSNRKPLFPTAPTESERDDLAYPPRSSAARVPAPRVHALSDRDRGDAESGDGVSPRPSPQAVEYQAGQQDRGEIRAQERLLGIGNGGQRPKLAAGTALR